MTFVPLLEDHDHSDAFQDEPGGMESGDQAVLDGSGAALIFEEPSKQTRHKANRLPRSSDMTRVRMPIAPAVAAMPQIFELTRMSFRSTCL
jgi:hypothetical protein